MIKIFRFKKMDSRRQDASVQTSSTSMSGIPPVRRASLTELSPRARWWRWWWMTMMMTVMVAVLVMELWPTAKSIQLHGATIRPMTNNEWPSSAGWAQREQFQTSLNLRSRPTQARQGGEDHHHHHNYDYMTPSMPGLKIISIVQRQPASEVDRTKPTKATKCLNVLLQVLIGYLIW